MAQQPEAAQDAIFAAFGQFRHRSPDDPLENSTCTHELRNHFPFESPLLDFCYGAALGTRLLLLGLAVAAKRNFGNGALHACVRACLRMHAHAHGRTDARACACAHA